MTILLFLTAASLALAAGALGVWGLAPGRAHGKAAADDALREMYGQYRTEMRALAQRRMLNASSDEEWLADIRARASATQFLAFEAMQLDGPRACSQAVAAASSVPNGRLWGNPIEAEIRIGSRKHHRVSWWVRWTPKIVVSFDFCLLLYFFAGITGVQWADPRPAPLAFAAAAAAMLTGAGFAYFRFTSTRRRRFKDDTDTIALRGLNGVPAPHRHRGRGRPGIQVAAIAAVAAVTAAGLATISLGFRANVPPPHVAIKAPPPVAIKAPPPGGSADDLVTDALYFHHKSAAIPPSAYGWLGALAEIAGSQHLKVSITGYASDFGNRAYDVALSRHRAIVVQDQLIALGLPPGQITEVIGLGAAGNPLNACQAQAQVAAPACMELRRVVIVLFP